MESKRLNILNVDDMAGIRCLLNVIAKEEGHNCYSASNGLEALEIIESIEIDLIFSDIKLPIMDGLELMAKIQGLNYNPNVIAMTGFNEEHIIQQAHLNGANKCIIKPFNVDDIRAIIRETAIGRQKVANI